MPRKEPYKKTIKPFAEVYAEKKTEQTYEAIKKEAARLTGELSRWKEDQLKNDPEEQFDVYLEMGYVDLVIKAERYLGRIYTRNQTIMTAQTNREIAKLSGVQEEFDKADEKVLKIEDEVVGLWWRIYKIHNELRPKIVVRTKKQILGLEDDPDDPEFYEQSNDDLDRMGTL